MLCATFMLELICLFTFVKYTVASSTLHRHRRQNGCVLPQHPANGQWSIDKSNARFSPGESILSGSILQVKCDQTYKLDGNDTIVCINEEWTSDIGMCLKTCPPLYSTTIMKVTCTYNNQKNENCTEAIDGTTASFKCADFYEDLGLNLHPLHMCFNGRWNHNIPECVPKCGQKSIRNNRTKIVNETNATRRDCPWQVALYTRDKKELICGGSLVTLNMIITAAHCVTDQQERAQPLPKENYIVALGKYYRKFDDPRDSKEAQFSELKKIIVNEKYSGPIQNFDSDIALLVTSTVFVPSLRVQPVCMDWNLQFKIGEDQVFGYVTGWGYSTKGSHPSEELKELKVPLIPETKCRKDLPIDYDRYYTYDKLCAGYLNTNTSVCQGDSGGGLVVKRNDDRFYLTGIVSLSPTSPREIDGCDSQQYGLYTKVAAHTEDFILKKVTEYGINAR